MALTKRTYTDHSQSTPITAQNLNDIQDAIITMQKSAGLATCSTGASTVAKAATLAGFVLETGSVVRVKFTNGNTATNPTLNVNSTGAKAIYTNKVVAIGKTAATSWVAGETVEFVYDGTRWVTSGASGITATFVGMHDIIKVQINGITSLPVTVTGLTGVTTSHDLVVEGFARVSPESSMGSDWGVTCGSNQITITGTFSGSASTTMYLTLGVPDKNITGDISEKGRGTIWQYLIIEWEGYFPTLRREARHWYSLAFIDSQQRGSEAV